MYELIQVSPTAYYMDCPTKVGFYLSAPGEVVLIDSGSDKDAAKKVRKILDARKWQLKAIFNTHSHADHIGGNQYLQAQTGCPVYVPGLDRAFTESPILEPMMLYGGFPMKELQNKFLMAKESDARKLTPDILPDGLTLIELPGHSYDMVGFRTADNVIFLADCLSSAETLEKYKIGFLYDVQAYLDTLEMVKTLNADCFVPAHAPQTNDIAPLAQLNLETTREIADRICELLAEARTFDDLLAAVFDTYGLTMTLQQNVLVGSTVRSYLSYLKNNDRVEYIFEDNHMKWKVK